MTAGELDELNQRFGLAGAVEFGPGPGGLTEVRISADGADAAIMLHGAHVTHFQPAGAEPVLWLSRQSSFAPGRPIRGGVPICFPWFADGGPTPDSPMHGFARTSLWEVRSVGRGRDGSIAVRLALDADDETRRLSPGRFQLTYTVTVAATLSMALQTTNVGPEPFTISEALHSYFAVSDVRHVKVHGLAGAEYLDKVSAGGRTRQDDPAVTFTAETDRLYLNTTAECVIEDPGMSGRITVAKAGSNSTVVWNPWIDKAARMPDFGDDEWTGMVCIETANAADNAVTVGPGRMHTLEARIAITA